MLARILGGLALVAAGFVLVWKTDWFQQNFGSIQWAEAKMGGAGGSRLLYKLIGITVIIIGALTMTNLHKIAFIALFGGLFGLTPAETPQ